MEQPDPQMHFKISMIKSGIRIFAGLCLIMSFPVFCGIALIIAEVLGVLEEIV